MYENELGANPSVRGYFWRERIPSFMSLCALARQQLQTRAASNDNAAQPLQARAADNQELPTSAHATREICTRTTTQTGWSTSRRTPSRCSTTSRCPTALSRGSRSSTRRRSSLRAARVATATGTHVHMCTACVAPLCAHTYPYVVRNDCCWTRTHARACS